ncbi:Cu_bind_like domain-containing protein [Cephalotus follicularis]|uniref:Cu_bind_like domain-containing protein n=1 Tax=Cephalotus follicularis TaxID=3775 RepID=A0A1Q3BD67_CEPFO|nr:Cu_bind_like domain-containing protein [Cephalotus follicularis]
MEGVWKERRGGGSIRLLVVWILMMVELECALGSLYRVGDIKGWSPNVNYTQWSSRQHIYVGDWIIFNFNKHLYNVLEVNKTSYETCNDKGFIYNITRGGRDVFQLTEAKPYYFLSSGGYCWQGMKLDLYVQDIPPSPSPDPALHKSNASPSTTVQKFIAGLLSIVFTWTLLSVNGDNGMDSISLNGEVGRWKVF